MLELVFFLTITLGFFFIVLKIFESQFKVKKRIDAFVNTEKIIIDIGNKEKENERIFKRFFKQFRNKTKSYFGDKISTQKEQKLEAKLLQAGSPFGMGSVDFGVFKLILCILLPIVFGLYGKLLNSGLLGIIVLAMLGLVISIYIPDFYINIKIKQRYKQALKELPDFLDILTVCLEAGLGFDGALSKVISKKTGVLSSEFHICLEQIRLGKTRKEGLTGVKERLAFDEIKALINSIIQAEKLGISMVQILRVKSQEEREKRKQRAEEEAMKAPIKILFPLVLFIFPSIFIVLLGPVILQMMNEFGK